MKRKSIGLDELVPTYDAANRLAGNITWMTRREWDGGLMDNLVYNYYGGTNRLNYISDGVPSGSYGSDIDNQTSGNYTYDGNGNATRDLGNGVTSISYNIRNLPVTLVRNGFSYTYSYDANDLRIYSSGSWKFYVNGADGKTEAVVDVSNPGIITHNIWGNDLIGQVKRNGGLTRYYHLKDHLGSVRVTVDADANVVAYDDFDPWGMTLETRSGNSGQADARYKFTGVERDVETGYDATGPRWYDSRIARFNRSDRYADRYAGVSPYSYSLNNPIVFSDASGDTVTVTIIRTAQSNTTTQGIISAKRTETKKTFSGHTIEPTENDNDPRANEGSYSAYQRKKSADGKKDYDPARIHLEGVTDESGNSMPGAQIHVGHDRTDTRGCILPGETSSRNGDAVGGSTNAMREINTIIKEDKGPIRVRIFNADRPHRLRVPTAIDMVRRNR